MDSALSVIAPRCDYGLEDAPVAPNMTERSIAPRPILTLAPGPLGVKGALPTCTHYVIQE